jgi:hypothetical protein
MGQIWVFRWSTRVFAALLCGTVCRHHHPRERVSHLFVFSSSTHLRNAVDIPFWDSPMGMTKGIEPKQFATKKRPPVLWSARPVYCNTGDRMGSVAFVAFECNSTPESTACYGESGCAFLIFEKTVFGRCFRVAFQNCCATSAAPIQEQREKKQGKAGATTVTPIAARRRCLFHALRPRGDENASGKGVDEATEGPVLGGAPPGKCPPPEGIVHRRTSPKRRRSRVGHPGYSVSSCGSLPRELLRRRRGGRAMSG